LKDFSTEKRCDCLEVYDGSTVRDTFIGKYCGTVDNSTLIVSTSNNMSLRFISDHSHNYKGFTSDYISVPEGQSELKIVFTIARKT
jgi:hypothetical protein